MSLGLTKICMAYGLNAYLPCKIFQHKSNELDHIYRNHALLRNNEK